MKIRAEYYTELQAAIVKAADRHATLATYLDNGLTAMRWRWDLLHASPIRITNTCVYAIGDLPLYDYLDDTHIDTALRRITAGI